MSFHTHTSIRAPIHSITAAPTPTDKPTTSATMTATTAATTSGATYETMASNPPHLPPATSSTPGSTLVTPPPNPTELPPDPIIEQLKAQTSATNHYRQAYHREREVHQATKGQLQRARTEVDPILSLEHGALLAAAKVNNVQELAVELASATARAETAEAERDHIARESLARERATFAETQAEYARRAEREKAAVVRAETACREVVEVRAQRDQLGRQLVPLNLENDHLARRIRLLEAELARHKWTNLPSDSN